MLIPSRRKFLDIACRTLSIAGGGSLLSRLGRVNAYAQTGSDYRALVCVFLFGGNDGNNSVIPIQTTSQGYTNYATARGRVALLQSDLLAINAADGTYGLHPRLVSLRNLYTQTKMAVVANVGTLVEPMTKAQYQAPNAKVPSNLFSHSDQQGQWQTSVPTGFSPTGWAGRAADIVGPQYNAPSTFPAIVSIAGSPLFATGVSTSPAVVTTNGATSLSNFPSTPNARTLAFQNLLNFSNGLSLVQASNGITSAAIGDAAALNAALAGNPALTTVFPTSSIGQQLRMAARVIQARIALGVRRQIFFCSMGGYDNHENLIPTQDSNFSQLDAALGAFHLSTQEIGVEQQVTTFTESEFGRTCQASSNVGSDHAWGSHHFVLGGAVKGGAMYGQFPTIALTGPDDVSSRGVWLPSTSLDQYGATLASWFGVNPADMPSVFPNLSKFPVQNLGFTL